MPCSLGGITCRKGVRQKPVRLLQYTPADSSPGAAGSLVALPPLTESSAREPAGHSRVRVSASGWVRNIRQACRCECPLSGRHRTRPWAGFYPAVGSFGECFIPLMLASRHTSGYQPTSILALELHSQYRQQLAMEPAQSSQSAEPAEPRKAEQARPESHPPRSDHSAQENGTVGKARALPAGTPAARLKGRQQPNGASACSQALWRSQTAQVIVQSSQAAM